MLLEAEIKNFQSLHNAKLSLGKLTVILGNSDSGKSAVLRAIKLVVFNTSTSGFVTEGQRKSEVSLTFDTGLKVAIERGPSLSTYRLLSNNEIKAFTKAGKDVPDQVKKALALSSRSQSVHFAGQFDAPYLLMESGTGVAQTLGNLTGINTLYEGIREANRRRLDAKKKNDIRKGDLEGLVVRLRAFRDLPQQVKEMERVEQSFKTASVLNQKIASIQTQLDTVEIAQEAFERASASIPSELEWSQLEEAEQAHGKIQELASLLGVIRELQQKQETYSKAYIESSQEVERLEDEYHQTLTEAGQCPWCGSTIGA